jgi:RNA 3'-terminal phosphate cyclase-like protein
MSKYTDLNGSNYFRLKIIYSTLLSKPIEIKCIRQDSMSPGIRDYEANFLKLVCQITNGSKVEISKSGDILKFTPGVITNNYGESFDFNCGNERNITYFLEGIFPIALYGKEPLKCGLTGITNDMLDISVC